MEESNYIADLAVRAEQEMGKASAEAVVIADAILYGFGQVAEAIREAAGIDDDSP